jgi:hypothetical protein
VPSCASSGIKARRTGKPPFSLFSTNNLPGILEVSLSLGDSTLQYLSVSESKGVYGLQGF